MQVSCNRQPSQAPLSSGSCGDHEVRVYKPLLHQNLAGIPIFLEEVRYRSQFVQAFMGNEWVRRPQQVSVQLVLM